MLGDAERWPGHKSTVHRDRMQQDLQDEEVMLFYEDYVKMQRKKQSKSLDQIHTIVLSDEIYERNN